MEGDASTEYNLANEAKHGDVYRKGHQPKWEFLSLVQHELLLAGQAGE